MKIYPLHANGIKVYCSDLITDFQDENIVYFMSICGYQTAVKGIIANFLEHNRLKLITEKKQYYLTRSYQPYATRNKKLPSGLLHSILLPQLSLSNNEEKSNSFFIFTENKEELPVLFFRHLDAKTDIPLHPSWTTWLWDTFHTHSWLFPLTTLIGTLIGYRVEFIPLQLQEKISTAIQTHQSEIINCMRKKGDSNYELALS